MRCGKKQCYLESLWTFRYNKDIASEKTLKSGEKKGVRVKNKVDFWAHLYKGS